MSGLSEQERDSLTECECGHFANEHSGDGCLANDYTEDWRPIRDGDKCSCTHSPTAINLHAIEAIVAAREAAARAEVLAEVEALAGDFDSNVDWSNGRHDYGDNAAWESAARSLRAILARHAEGGEDS